MIYFFRMETLYSSSGITYYLWIFLLLLRDRLYVI